MYGFLLRPKWIAFHLLVAASIALMVWLGFWQLRRLDERKDFNEIVAARIDQPPVPLDDLLADMDAGGGEPSDLEWRQVTVAGTWLPGQVIWFNRSQDGLAGDNVLTALTEADGTTVVVNRGFVSIAETVFEPPQGDVQVLGRVRVANQRQRGELTDASADGPVTEVRRVDLDQLATQLPGEVAPVYLDLVASVPPIADNDPLPTPVPGLDEGPHLSYAVQWFIFAAAVLVGWVLAVRRSISTRRRRGDATLTDGAAERAAQDSTTAADAASTTTTI